MSSRGKRRIRAVVGCPSVLATPEHPRDPPLVLTISGRTRAGKTTLATELSESLRWPWTSFSSYVRAEAQRRGIPETRRALQDLGAGLIDELGAEEFCRRMLEHGTVSVESAPFIVEGVRHLAVLKALRRVLAPAKVLHVHLDVSDAERNRRLAGEGVSAAEGQQWERHSTERDVLAGLPGAADLLVDADRAREEVANTVVEWLGLRRDT